jgi:hypothetical protein
MKNFQAKIDIAARAKKVWDTMIAPESYKEWVNVAWPGSYYEGNWGPDQKVKFISPSQGGTLAEIVEYKPYKYILAKHIAVINADGTEDQESEAAKKWIGTMESYTFHEVNGKTELESVMKTNPEWGQMFADAMPRALAKLKEICEK